MLHKTKWWIWAFVFVFTWYRYSYQLFSFRYKSLVLYQGWVISPALQNIVFCCCIKPYRSLLQLLQGGLARIPILDKVYQRSFRYASSHACPLYTETDHAELIYINIIDGRSMPIGTRMAMYITLLQCGRILWLVENLNYILILF